MNAEPRDSVLSLRLRDLADRARDGNEDVRLEAVITLGGTRDLRGLAVLTEVLDRREAEDVFVRREAVLGLREFGAVATEALAAVAQDPCQGKTVRREAVDSLARIHSPETQDALDQLRVSEDRRVRRWARRARAG